MKLSENYLEQTERIFQSIYSNGYTDGYNFAKEEYGIDLHGWCSCGKPIEGRWVGMANFCPWCGRKIDWNNTTN